MESNERYYSEKNVKIILKEFLDGLNKELQKEQDKKVEELKEELSFIYLGSELHRIQNTIDKIFGVVKMKMKIEELKEECSRCEGKGCVECAWSGWLWKNKEDLK